MVKYHAFLKTQSWRSYDWHDSKWDTLIFVWHACYYHINHAGTSCWPFSECGQKLMTKQFHTCYCKMPWINSFIFLIYRRFGRLLLLTASIDILFFCEWSYFQFSNYLYWNSILIALPNFHSSSNVKQTFLPKFTKAVHIHIQRIRLDLFFSDL